MENKCKEGYTEKDGECVKKNNYISKKKKSYNPFKMWLPWIIGILGLAWSGYAIYKLVLKSSELENTIIQGVIHSGMGKVSVQALGVGFFDKIIYNTVNAR